LVLLKIKLALIRVQPGIPLHGERPVLACYGGRPKRSVASPRAPRNTGLEAPCQGMPVVYHYT